MKVNFHKFLPFRTPEMTPGNKFENNHNFGKSAIHFSGSQKFLFRFAIYQKATEVEFQFPAKIISIVGGRQCHGNKLSGNFFLTS